jgi:glutathionylspermidine synthase
LKKAAGMLAGKSAIYQQYYSRWPKHFPSEYRQVGRTVVKYRGGCIFMVREQRTARQKELCEKIVTYLPPLRKAL